jgi:NADH:ubiquinone oxidoreductase subunit 3 (subunit A)
MAEWLFYTQQVKVRVFHCLLNFFLILMEFFYLFIFFFINFFLGIILYSISYLLILKNLTNEKNTTYECGFLPFEDTRGVFEVEFYLVSILFVIFDLEIMFLFPWVLVVVHSSSFGIITMLIFLSLLLLVFFYELSQGVLNW